MLNKIDLKFLCGAIACFIATGLIMFGKSGITFVDPINEVFEFAITFTMGIMCLVGIKK